jgi:hypothetical protein
MAAMKKDRQGGMKAALGVATTKGHADDCETADGGESLGWG